MSGINEMTNKIKKKMTLNDLPIPKEENYTKESIAVHTAVHLDEQQAPDLACADLQRNALSPLDESVQHGQSKTSTSHNEREYSNTVSQVAVHNYSNPVNERNKTVYGRKMTLYLTEEMYKVFNDIYARRIIDGRKTDKAALICEAVALLHKEETK